MNIAGKQVFLSSDIPRALKLEFSKKLLKEGAIVYEKLASCDENVTYCILNRFEGVEFKELSSDKRYLLYGVPCAFACLNGNVPFPVSDHPIFSLTMLNVIICCTGLDAGRRELHDLVTQMGGSFSRALVHDVTHLVADANTSEKYKVAVRLGIPVVRPRWISDHWKSLLSASPSTESYLASALQNIDTFRLPAFAQCHICVSHFDGESRHQMKLLIEKHGGKYSDVLIRDECTHLIVSEPSGDKYTSAVKWKNIFVVHSHWLFDSIDAQGRLDEHIYHIEKYQTQRPISLSQATLDSDRRTACSSFSSTSRAEQENDDHENDESLLRCLNSATTTHYLQGIRVFLSPQLSSLQTLMLKKIIMHGGGIRFAEPNRNVTHFIVSPSSTLTLSEQEVMTQLRLDVVVVSSEWLRECCRRQSPVSTARYLQPSISHHHPTIDDDTENSNETTGGFPLSRQRSALFSHASLKRSLSAMSSNDPPRVRRPLSNSLSSSSTALNLLLERRDSVSAGMSRASSTVLNASRTSMDENVPDHIEEYSSQEEATMQSAKETTKPLSFLTGLKCHVVGFNATQQRAIVQAVLQHGGEVLTATDHSVPTHSVIPFLVEKLSMDTMNTPAVTEYWLEQCIEDGRWVDPASQVWYQPHKGPFVSIFGKNDVIGITGYDGLLRDHVGRLVGSLGATFTEQFSRKNTLLLCPSSAHVGSPKCVLAHQHDIPIVSHQYLLDCLLRGTRCELTAYRLSREGVSVAKQPEQETVRDTALTRCPSLSPTLVLTQCYVMVSQRLSHRRQSLMETAKQLGATLLFQYDKVCTHLIHAGSRSQETFKEFKLARQLGAHIVHPVWLQECWQQQKRVPESLYPHTYNPQRVLTLVSQSSLFMDGEPDNARGTVQVSVIEKEERVKEVSELPKAIPEENQSDRLKNENNETDIDHSNSHHQDDSHETKGTPPRSSNAIQSALASMLDEFLVAGDEKPPQSTLTEPLPLQQQHTKRRKRKLQQQQQPSLASLLTSELDSHAHGSPLRDVAMKRKRTIAPSTQSHDRGDDVGYENPDAHSEIQKLLALKRRTLKRTEEEEENDNPSMTVDTVKHLLSSSTAEDPLPVSENKDSGYQTRSSGKRSQTAATARLSVNVDNTPTRLGRGKRRSGASHATPHIVSDYSSPIKSMTAVMPHRNHSPEQYRFILSAMTDTQKKTLMAGIRQLGGTVSDTTMYRADCTHLLVGAPSRAEKYLAAAAAGKWVLRVAYLECSLQAGYFLPEEAFEWGNTVNEKKEIEEDAEMRAWASAPRRWRLSSVRPFEGWCVLLDVDQKRRDGFVRLLQAGGVDAVQVVNAQSGWQNAEWLRRVTHCFVDVSKATTSVLMGIDAVRPHLLVPEYIAEYLAKLPAPDPQEFRLL